MNTKTDIIKNFRRYLLLERSYSENTLDAYMRDIDKLLLFALRKYTEEGEGALLRISREDLQEFLAELCDLGIHLCRLD